MDTDPPATGLITASGLKLTYGPVVVIEDVELALAPGQVTALIGPNGCGKSTLLRALARLHAPSGGDVRLDGVAIHDLGSRELATRITMLSQHRAVPGGVTVREVVEYGRHPHRGRWGSGDPDGAGIVDRALRITGTAGIAGRAVDTLSGGQVQRVWLASCLAQDTDVLLLDEPTTYLDLRYQIELLDTVRDLADRHTITVGIVLHDLDQAAALADEIVLMNEGRIVAAGLPEDVLTPERLTAAYGIRVDIDRDPVTGRLRTHARGRHNGGFDHVRTPSREALAHPREERL